VRAIYSNEELIKRWADTDPSLKRPGDMTVGEAQACRDNHIADTEHAIDYALTTAAYDDAPCPTCQLPAKPLAFALAVADFDQPAIQCPACLGLGKVREKKSDPASKEAFRVISYVKRVLPDVIRCAKIRARSPGFNEAYVELEEEYKHLIIKFSQERSTFMEPGKADGSGPGGDAEQGARTGLIDAARLFDPFKMKDGRYPCATFATVAWNWCRRNSAARKEHQKRPGVYATSIEELGGKSGVEGSYEFITRISSFDGALGVRGTLEDASQQGDLMIDLHRHIAGLSERQQQVMSGQLRGLSVAKIACEMELSKVSVRNLKRAAIGLLKERMVDYGVEFGTYGEGSITITPPEETDEVTALPAYVARRVTQTSPATLY
jgi:DNA-directed RNA polymerase specialized sigma24 family protein